MGWVEGDLSVSDSGVEDEAEGNLSVSDSDVEDEARAMEARLQAGKDRRSPQYEEDEGLSSDESIGSTGPTTAATRETGGGAVAAVKLSPVAAAGGQVGQQADREVGANGHAVAAGGGGGSAGGGAALESPGGPPTWRREARAVLVESKIANIEPSAAQADAAAATPKRKSPRSRQQEQFEAGHDGKFEESPAALTLLGGGTPEERMAEWSLVSHKQSRPCLDL